MKFKCLSIIYLTLFSLFCVSCNIKSVYWQDLTDEEKKELLLERYTPLNMTSSDNFDNEYTRKVFGWEFADSSKILRMDLGDLKMRMENAGADISMIKTENIVKIEDPFEAKVLVTDLVIKEETVTLVYCQFSINYALATIFSPDAFDTVFGFDNTSRENKGAWLLNAYVTAGIANPVFQYKTIEKDGEKYRTKMAFQPTPGESALEQITDDLSEDGVQEKE